MVEGEKAADAAAQYLPEGWAVTTSPGGGNAYAHTDWTPLAGRHCVIWPDNDSPGVKYAAQVEAMLRHISASVRIVAPPRGLPDSWDLADPLPGTLTAAAVIALITTAPVAQPIGEPDLPELPPGFDNTIRYRPLGFDGKSYFFQRHIVGPNDFFVADVLEMSSAELCNEKDLLDLYPDPTHWDRIVGAEQGNANKDRWKSLGATLIKQCLGEGKLDDTRKRGRGVYVDPCPADKQRVIYHQGGALYVNGLRLHPATIVDSRYVYETRKDGPVPASTPLPDSEARKLVDICRLLRWDRPLHAEMFAGWHVQALASGATDWRAHIWLTGPAGSGKTWVLKNISLPVLGRSLAFEAHGTTTEAGIRQGLEGEARPVVFDEAEAGGDPGEKRRAAIIELMRAASSGATVNKGGPQGTGTEWHVRSAFLLASIGAETKTAADESRITTLSLLSGQAETEAQKEAAARHFAEIRRAITTLTPDWSAGLLTRVISNVPLLKSAAEIFGATIADKVGGRRAGDQLGTLCAGLYLLHSTEPLTPELAKQFVDARDWSQVTRTAADMREDTRVIEYLAQHLVRPLDLNNNQRERTLGTLMRVASGRETDPNFGIPAAREILARVGVRYEDDATKLVSPASAINATPPLDGFFLHTRCEALHRILERASDYGRNWGSILKAHPEARRAANPVNFPGLRTSRAVWLPARVLLGD